MHEPLGFLAPDKHNTWPTCRAAVDCTFQGEASRWRCKLSPRYASPEGGGSAEHVGFIQRVLQKRGMFPISHYVSGVLCGYDLDAGRQPLLDMLSTTHERNPTFPCGSFYMNKTCTTGLIAATCSALKNFSLCLLPRRMSFRTFCKRTSTWVFSCTTAATRLLNMSR